MSIIDIQDSSVGVIVDVQEADTTVIALTGDSTTLVIEGVGTQGPKGDAGSMVRSGVGAPSSSLGNNGDFYLDTASYNFYGPKTAGAWGSPVSLIGPLGPIGPAGSAGSNGKSVLNGTRAPLSDRKSTRLNSSHIPLSRMPSSA